MLGVVAVTAVVFAAFDFAAASLLRSYMLRRADSALNVALDIGAHHLRRLETRAESASPLTFDQDPYRALGDYYLALMRPRGQPLVLLEGSSVAPKVLGGAVTLASTGRAKSVPGSSGKGEVRERARTVPGGELVASTSLANVDSTVNRLEFILSMGSLAALAVVAAGVFALVRRGLRPLEAMAAEADRVTAGDLETRVSVERPGSEVGRLGEALNEMLERISLSLHDKEASEQRMRTFLANASHELRTPLASLVANAQLYTQGVLSEPSEVDEAVRRIESEAKRMSRLVDDMLRLARLDQRPELRDQPVDLSVLAETCLERVRAAAPARHWRAEVEPGVVVHGDDELLRRAVDNLLANVVAHTPAGTEAVVTLRREGANAVLEVRDLGPGVPAGDLVRIFDRFYRSRGAPRGKGSGLGLAIVAEVAATYGGSAHAAPNEPQGLRVSFVLPVLRPQLSRSLPVQAGED
jgi:two-component system OmpR family sensor kinase